MVLVQSLASPWLVSVSPWPILGSTLDGSCPVLVWSFVGPCMVLGQVLGRPLNGSCPVLVQSLAGPLPVLAWSFACGGTVHGRGLSGSWPQHVQFLSNL